MKKKKWLFIILITILSIVWIICMHFTTLELIENINRNIKEDYSLKVPENENSNLGIGEKLYTKTFESYVVSNNWIESEEHSTNSKFFYVASGEEREERPNNISVNAGTNKYSGSEHEKFRDAILSQLSYQISNSPDCTLNANGGFTKDNNYVVYEFDIFEKSDNILTKQFYIVGDYKYVLVHETVYNFPSDEVDAVARKIVDSFEWKD